MTTGIQTRPRRVRLASVMAGLLTSTTALTVVGMTGVVPTAAAYASTRDSSAGRAISRSTILARGKTWIDAHVPYNQDKEHEGYRMDCSGFVSMAWDLTSSLTTVSLPSVSTKLASTSQLRPGDILDIPGDHVVLFVGWSRTDHGRHRHFDLYEESFPGSGGGTVASYNQDIRGSYYSRFMPYRFKKVVEHAPSSPPTHSKYYVNTFATASGFLSPHCMGDDSQHCRPQGVLFAAPSNYVFCKTWGDEVKSGSQYNHWWLLTDLDRVYPGKSGRAYVSAYYLRNWGNDVAKDNSGRVIPNC